MTGINGQSGKTSNTPYDENAHDPSWLQVLDTWKWHKVDGECRWQTQGNCPRCGHETVVEVEAVPKASFTGIDIICIPPGTVEFRCYCSHEHQKDKGGCGLLIEGMKGP